ncbi:hypothetical protein LCGC14_1368010 [marine sediment metagenome]|uniref:Uncharacterized protein n=1 Tax=marine sediment metagenome TaxID=412755 RepID=A0A0F9K658_9ZZZZ
MAKPGYGSNIVRPAPRRNLPRKGQVIIVKGT